MGWWSTGIMAGDSPLDWEDEFYHICGVEKYPNDGNERAKIPAEAFESNLKKLVEVINCTKGWELQIAYQVLGVMMMSSGCHINDTLKAAIVKAAEEDEWAAEDPQRKKDCEAFAKKIKDYNGTPTEVKSKGLFEVLGEAMQEGNKFVNQIPPSHDN